MPPTIIPFKAGLVLLLGIVSAPVLKPLFEKAVKTTAKVGVKAKKVASDAALELKIVTAEAVQEHYAGAE